MRAQPEVASVLRPDTPRSVRVEAFGAEVLLTEASADACKAALLAVSSRIDSPSDAGWIGLVGWPLDSPLEVPHWSRLYKTVVALGP
jgi:hypothetical protein